MDKEIELVNKIIAEAVLHGADVGGSYDQNELGLKDAINQWLKFKGLENEYTIREVSLPWFDSDICTYCVFQIVKIRGTEDA